MGIWWLRSDWKSHKPHLIAVKILIAAKNGVRVGCNGSDASVTVPEGFTRIGEGAFRGNTTIQTVNLGDHVTEIAANAFEGCTSQTAVTGTAALNTIGDSAFAGCSSLREMK